MTEHDRLPTAAAADAEVAAFLRQVAAVPPPPRVAGRRGRLVFALDATASREATWDRACRIQGEMFEATAALGGLEVQLVYFRGYRECKASSWVASADDLLRRMATVRCEAGRTQLCRVLAHAAKEAGRSPVHALVFVGDSMEEELDELGHRAAELGMLGIPCFLFQERDDGRARRAFQEVARLTGGAWCRFDLASARHLRDLLAAVAVYAAGGRAALEDFGRGRDGIVAQLTHQLRSGPSPA